MRSYKQEIVSLSLVTGSDNVFSLDTFRRYRGQVEGLYEQLRQRKQERTGKRFKTDRERVKANR